VYISVGNKRGQVGIFSFIFLSKSSNQSFVVELIFNVFPFASGIVIFAFKSDFV
jgi:hypothetical protein